MDYFGAWVAYENAHHQPEPERNVLLEHGEEGIDVDLALQRLARNEYVTFRLHTVIDQSRELPPWIPPELRLTLPQAREVSAALMTSSLLEEFDLCMGFCSVPAVVPFVDYIRASPRLKEVRVVYEHVGIRGDPDPDEVRQGYIASMPSIVQAVQDNPSIQRFTVELPTTTPQLPISLLLDGIYNLLANKDRNNPPSSSSLQEIHIIDDNPLTTELALAISTGLSRNSGTLKKLSIRVSFVDGPWDLLLGGLAASSVESFSLQCIGEESIEILPMLAKMLVCTPSLKEIIFSDFRSHQDVGKIFLDLRHPACSGLKKMKLEFITCVSADVETNSFGVAPKLPVNRTLSELILRHPFFEEPGAVRLLWNVVGLKEVHIQSPRHHTADDTFLEDWAEFIRRNTELETLTVNNDWECDPTFVTGVLDGARGHGSLKKIRFSCIMRTTVESTFESTFGARLVHVLQETPSITELRFEKTRLAPGFVFPLAEALNTNSSLTTLCLRHCHMEVSSINAILVSLLVNQTLKNLSIEAVNVDRDEPGEQAFLSSGIFQINKTLVKVAISKCDLRGGRASLLLQENYTLKTLWLDSTLIDNESMISLGQALELPNAVLQDIGLPKNSSKFQLENVQEGTRAFLRSLARMSTIHTVRFGGTMANADEDMRRLLLLAVKENKKLHHLHQYVGYWEKLHRGPFVSEIEYYLKLNRFGRQVLDTPNVLPSLWPRILSPMTDKPEDADALFFFVREFFSRQQAPQLPQQSQPTRKRARSI